MSGLNVHVIGLRNELYEYRSEIDAALQKLDEVEKVLRRPRAFQTGEQREEKEESVTPARIPEEPAAPSKKGVWSARKTLSSTLRFLGSTRFKGEWVDLEHYRKIIPHEFPQWRHHEVLNLLSQMVPVYFKRKENHEGRIMFLRTSKTNKYDKIRHPELP